MTYATAADLEYFEPHDERRGATAEEVEDLLGRVVRPTRQFLARAGMRRGSPVLESDVYVDQKQQDYATTVETGTQRLRAFASAIDDIQHLDLAYGMRLLRRLNELFWLDRDEDEPPISLESLRGLLAFLRGKQALDSPRLFASKKGTLRLTWRNRYGQLSIDFRNSADCDILSIQTDPARPQTKYRSATQTSVTTAGELLETGPNRRIVGAR